MKIQQDCGQTSLPLDIIRKQHPLGVLHIRGPRQLKLLYNTVKSIVQFELTVCETLYIKFVGCRKP